MYIEPGTTIYLLQGVPLENDYENTILFQTVSEQFTHFTTQYTKKSFVNQTYQRLDRGIMRLKVAADSIAGYNYCMFRNNNYSNKWWYAFILSVEWINNEVAEIRIELDVVQTWLFEAIPEVCFIERSHQGVSDNPGDNLVPENLETGEYIVGDVVPANALNEMCIVIAGTYDASINPNQGSVYHGIYTGLHYEYFDVTTEGIAAANQFLNNYSQNPDGIVSVYMMPKVFKGNPDTLDTPTPSDIQVRKYTTNPNSANPYGISINNGKMKTFPYCFLYCTNNNGSNAIFPYEYFSGQTFMQFRMLGDCNPNPSVMIYPRNYKGISDNIDEKLILAGYPQCCFNIDTFRAYLAMTASQVIGSTGNALGELGSTSISRYTNYRNAQNGLYDGVKQNRIESRLSENILGHGVTQLGSVIGGLMGAAVQHHYAPYQLKGQPSANLNVSTNTMQFNFYYKKIRDDFALRIDEYFDMYGYAQNNFERPPRALRNRWCYVKTRGATFRGDISASVAKRLSEIYDSGIRWYRSNYISDIGNYSHSLGAQNGILGV